MIKKCAIGFLLAIVMATGVLPSFLVTVCATTSEPTVMYRYREKQYTTSKTTLDSPWVLYDTAYKYEHTGERVLYSYYTEEDFYKTTYCVHKVENVNKYTYESSYFYATASEYAERAAYDAAHGGSSKIGYYKPTAGYRRYTCCQYKKVSETTYYYYKWGEWSEWTYTPIEPSDNIEVETKIIATYYVYYDANGGNGAPAPSAKRSPPCSTAATV